MKKIALCLSGLLLIGLVSYGIVSNGSYYHQLRTEDVILNVFLTGLDLLIFFYLLTPVFRMAVRAYKNLKEGKALLTRSDESKKKMSTLYKILLFLVGYSLFFGLVKAGLCAVYPDSCRSDGFGLFMIMSMALMVGWAIFVFLKVIISVGRKIIASQRASNAGEKQ